MSWPYVFRSMLLNWTSTSYTVSLIRLTVFLMSSGSWHHVEDTWSVLVFRAAPFRRRATCHSSPVSDIYVNSPDNHVASLCTQKYKNNICFVNTFLIQVPRWVGESASGTIFSVTHKFPLPVSCRCSVVWHGIWSFDMVKLATPVGQMFGIAFVY